MSDLSTIMAALAQLAATSDGKTVNLAIAMPGSTVVQGVHVTYGASSKPKKQTPQQEEAKKPQVSKEALASGLPPKKPVSAPPPEAAPEATPEPTPEATHEPTHEAAPAAEVASEPAAEIDDLLAELGNFSPT